MISTLQRMTIHLGAVALIATLLPLIVLGGTPPTRPPTLQFAFIYGVNSTLFDYDAVQLFAGLKAAEQVINSGDWLDNTTVSFTHVPFSLTWSATQQAATVAAAISSGITGIVAADWVATGVAYAVSNGSVPVIASRSLSTNEFGDPSYDFVNSMRMPIDVQYRTMLNHAQNDDTTQCSSFALLFRPFFPTLLSNFMATVAELQLQAPTIINLGANYLQPVDTVSVLNQFYNSTVYPPRCTLIFAMSSDIQDLLVAFYNDARVPRTMKYYSSDFGGKSSFVDPVLGTAPFENLLFVTDAGNFMSTTNPNAIGYRSALSAWIASNPTLPPTLNASVGIDAVPNTVSYEGYMAGMMVGNVLMGTMNLTAGGWINSIYAQTLFWIGDNLMGPFIKHCLANPLLTMPCFCNVGSSTQFVLRVDNTTGRIGPLGGDAIQNRPSYLSSLPTSCYPDDSSLPTSVRIQLFAPLTMSAVSSLSYDNYYSSTRLQAETINAANSIPGVMLSVGYMNKFIVLPSDMSDAAAAFPRYMATRQATVIVGNWFPPESITLPVVNFFTSPITLATDEPLSAPTQLTPYTWYFKPTLADVTHACVQLLASIYQPGGVLVTAISGDSVGFRLAEQSLNTLQFPLESGSGVVDLTDAAALSTLIRSQLDAASGGKAIVLFVATLDTAAVVNVVNAASSATAAVIAAHSDGGAAAFASFAMVIATEMGNLYTAKFQMSSPSSLLRFPIYFSWQLMPFFETTNPARIAMMATMNTTDPAVVELQTLYASTVVMGLLSAAMNVLTSRPTAQNIMAALYSLGTISSNGVTVGPFRTDNCTADVIAANRVDRSCQCFKAMRTLHVYDYRGWLSGSSSYNPHFVWTMPTCGPLYEPLRVASQLNVAMVVGIAVPCGAAFLVGVGYFVLCHGRRSNRAAPKDPEVPFAMVFTDIQSSTSLWARAPEAMGPALEQHHELLRKLVGRHDGYEVKTIGDSFMVAFKKASDAARFALAIQTTLYDEAWPEEIDDVYIALAQEAWQEKQEAEAEKSKSEISLGGGSGRGHPPSHAPQQWEDEATYAANWNGIRVRVGLHWGIGSVKLDPVSQGYDYYGTLVNTAARVEGVGNGGQVLVTKDMFDQLESESFDLASIDVVPMGPQPLRGLDAPVPLYQLSPMPLRTRQFAALRLDVEIELDDESSDAGTSLNDGSTQLSAADDTPEMHMDRLLRRAKDGAAHREYLWRVAGFLTTAFRTTTASWRKDTMKQLMKKWHVKPRVVPSGVKETADKTLQYDIIALSVKVGLAAEEAERASKRHNNDTRSIGASSRLSAGTNHEGLQIRRGSIRRFSNRSSHVEDL